MSAFCLLLCQKFMSIVIGKLSLQGELPTLRDSSFLILLAIHFSTFLLFHTHTGEEIMLRIKASECRIVIQETFKGYGKGLNLLKLINKGMKLQPNPVYFVAVLLIRGSASAMFKATCISFVTQKPIKTRKAKMNLLFITIPSIILYLLLLIIRTTFKISLSSMLALNHESITKQQLEEPLIHFFVTFMVISRCMRALVKILKGMRGTKRRHSKIYRSISSPNLTYPLSKRSKQIEENKQNLIIACI